MGARASKQAQPSRRPPSPPPSAWETKQRAPFCGLTQTRLQQEQDAFVQYIESSCAYHPNSYHSLLVGHPGGGKSTVVNSVLSTAEGRLTTAELTMQSPNHVTTAYGRYPVAGSDNAPFCLHSLEGCFYDGNQSVHSDYKRRLELICDGVLPPGSQKGYVPNWDELNAHAQNMPRCPMDGFILVVAADTVKDKTAMRQNREILEHLMRRKAPNGNELTFAVVLTKLDRVAPGNTISDILRSDKAQEVINTLTRQDTLGVEPTKVFPVISHQDFSAGSALNTHISLLHMYFVQHLMAEVNGKSKMASRSSAAFGQPLTPLPTAPTQTQ